MRRLFTVLPVVVGALVFVLGACSGAGTTSASTACTPGMSAPCVCPGTNAMGSEVCSPAGAYLTCVCHDAGHSVDAGRHGSDATVDAGKPVVCAVDASICSGRCGQIIAPCGSVIDCPGCPDGATCGGSGVANTCGGGCVPSCSSVACGGPDGCGGTCMTGTCPASGQTCVNGECTCNAASCPDGCCLDGAVCETAGSAGGYCGVGGGACSMCPAGMTCEKGECLASAGDGGTMAAVVCVETPSAAPDFTTCAQECALVGRSCTTGCAGAPLGEESYEASACAAPPVAEDTCTTTITWEPMRVESIACCCTGLPLPGAH